MNSAKQLGPCGLKARCQSKRGAPRFKGSSGRLEVLSFGYPQVEPGNATLSARRRASVPARAEIQIFNGHARN